MRCSKPLFALLGFLCLLTVSVNAQFTTIWSEDFNYADGTTSGPAGIWTAFPCSACGASGDHFEVRNNLLEGRDVNDWVTFETEVINIAGCDTRFSLTASETGDHDSPTSATGINIDYLDIYYSIDGGPFVVIENWNNDGEALHTFTGDSQNGVADDDDWQSTTVSQLGLTGNTLQLRIMMRNTSADERLQIDDILVECRLLPVEYLYFTADAQDEAVNLRWETAQESNNDYFELQRSLDGVSFASLSRIQGAGTSEQSVAYEFTDYDAGTGSVYYRLKQVDFDGNHSFSKTVELSPIQYDSPLIGVFPQPAAGGFNILLNLPQEWPVAVQLFDLAGKAVLTQEDRLQAGEQQLRVESGHLPAGVYLMRMTLGNERLLQKVILD